MCCVKVDGSETLYIPVGTNDINRELFNFSQNLEIIERGAKVVSIRAYSSDEMPKNPEGLTVVSPAILKSSFLSLKKKVNGDYIYKKVPVTDLITAKNAGIAEMLEPVEVDWSQSELKISNGTVLTAGTVFVFRVIYTRNKC
jgi:hypothetical protein